MTDLIAAVGAGQALLAVVIIGAAPRLALRLIVRAHPRDTLLREQIMADFEDVPLLLRPFWVASQLEVAVVEGLGTRLGRAPTSFAEAVISATFRSQAIRDDVLASLNNVPVHKQPLYAVAEAWSGCREGWRIRPLPLTNVDGSDRRSWRAEVSEVVNPGCSVKVVFESKQFVDYEGGFGEAMWVHVTERRVDRLTGTLNNVPISIPRLGWGSRITFTIDAVTDYDVDPAQ